MKRYSFLLVLLVTTFSATALTTQTDSTAVLTNTSFFTAIISGVLLALVFQIILTALSVAMGISMVGNLKQSYVDSKVKPNSQNNNDYEFNQNYNNNGVSTGVKISMAFGAWSLFTTALSLFGACAIALNLNFFGNLASNLTAALVIWALFFLILFYLETKIVNTVIGGLITTATSGLKSSANVIQQLFTASPEKKVDNVIGSTIDKIRKEFDVNLNTSDLSNALDKFFNKVDKKLPDYNTLKDDIEKIAKSSKSKNSSGKYMAIQQVLTKAIDEAGDNGNFDPQGKVGQLKKLLSDLKEAYTSDKSTAEGVKDIVAEYTTIEKSQIDDKLSELKNYISNATPDRLSKDQLNEDLNNILSDPKSIGAILSSKFDEFNEEKVIDLLSANTALDKNQLNTYADKISSVIQKVKKTAEENDFNTLKERTDKLIGDFFNNTNRDELNYNDLKEDLNAIFDNPKESLSIIKARLNKMDSSTVKAIVTNNKYIDESHINSIVSQIDSTIDSVKSKVSSIEQKATEQIEITKRKAVIQAEHARATAASAAWWLVLTVVFSGGAAMLGAWIEIT